MSRLGNMYVLEVDEHVEPTIPVRFGIPKLKKNIGHILQGSPQPSETFVVQMKPQKKYCVYFTPHENIFENIDAAFDPEYAEIRYEFIAEGREYEGFYELAWTKDDLKNADTYVLATQIPDDSNEANLEYPHKFQLELCQSKTNPRLEEIYTFHFRPPIQISKRKFDNDFYEKIITVSSLKYGHGTYYNQVVRLTGANGILSFHANLDRKFSINGVIKECDLQARNRGSGNIYNVQLSSNNSSVTITLVTSKAGSESGRQDSDQLEEACSRYKVFKSTFDTGNKYVLFL